MHGTLLERCWNVVRTCQVINRLFLDFNHETLGKFGNDDNGK
jgi:hypothetical protein